MKRAAGIVPLAVAAAWPARKMAARHSSDGLVASKRGHFETGLGA
jgi:hypothetical protein